jgi:hypothetical protein
MMAHTRLTSVVKAATAEKRLATSFQFTICEFWKDGTIDGNGVESKVVMQNRSPVFGRGLYAAERT